MPLPPDLLLLSYYAAQSDTAEDHSGKMTLSLKLKILPVPWFYGR